MRPASLVFSIATASSSRSTVTNESPAFSAMRSAVSNRRAVAGAIELACARALDFRQFGKGEFDRRQRLARSAAGAVDQAGRQAFLVVQQDFQHMFGGELLVVLPQRQRLRALNEAARPLGVFLQIHRILPSAPPAPRSDVRRSKTRWPPVTALLQM
jgi:hypothetical protein